MVEAGAILPGGRLHARRRSAATAEPPRVPAAVRLDTDSTESQSAVAQASVAAFLKNVGVQERLSSRPAPSEIFCVHGCNRSVVMQSSHRRGKKEGADWRAGWLP